MRPIDHAWTLLKQQSLPSHHPAIQGLMARHYAADDENRFTPAFGPFEHSDMENWEGPSGDELRERMERDEVRGALARQSTGLARGGGDEHIDAEAYNQLAAEGRPDPIAMQHALRRQQNQGQREALGSDWPYR